MKTPRDKIIIECGGGVEFIADASTLEAITCCYYDPYPNSIRYPKKYRSISYHEYCIKRNARKSIYIYK